MAKSALSSVENNTCNDYLPEVKLSLVCLRHRSETVKVREKLDSVMRLYMVHSVAEHLKQSVKCSPSVRFEYRR